MLWQQRAVALDTGAGATCSYTSDQWLLSERLAGSTGVARAVAYAAHCTALRRAPGGSCAAAGRTSPTHPRLAASRAAVALCASRHQSLRVFSVPRGRLGREGRGAPAETPSVGVQRFAPRLWVRWSARACACACSTPGAAARAPRRTACWRLRPARRLTAGEPPRRRRPPPRAPRGETPCRWGAGWRSWGSRWDCRPSSTPLARTPATGGSSRAAQPSGAGAFSWRCAQRHAHACPLLPPHAACPSLCTRTRRLAWPGLLRDAIVPGA